MRALKSPRIYFSGTFYLRYRVFFVLVNLTTKQVETLFGALEYIESRLQALGLVVDLE
jgi:hypothetical protein